jgi:hypothetical protein
MTGPVKIAGILLIALVGVLASGAALAQTETTVPTETSTPPTLTAVQPANPVASKPGGPVIQSITAQIDPAPLGVVPETIHPQFHFIAPNGNAVLLHREIVESSSGNVNFNPSTAIDIPAEAQKTGAVFTGGWGCGTAQAHTTVRVYILDADGNKSNEVQYTVHCNGG